MAILELKENLAFKEYQVDRVLKVTEGLLAYLEWMGDLEKWETLVKKVMLV